jgi:hypothetical protein
VKPVALREEHSPGAEDDFVIRLFGPLELLAAVPAGT